MFLMFGLGIAFLVVFALGAIFVRMVSYELAGRPDLAQ